MSAKARRMTLPLPRNGTGCTVAPAARASAAVSSPERLSNTWQRAAGRLSRKAATTAATVAASFLHGTTSATRNGVAPLPGVPFSAACIARGSRFDSARMLPVAVVGDDPHRLLRPVLDAAVAAVQAQAKPAMAGLAGRKIDGGAEAQ